jgi:hypothetical protein
MNSRKSIAGTQRDIALQYDLPLIGSDPFPLRFPLRLSASLPATLLPQRDYASIMVFGIMPGVFTQWRKEC